MHRRKIATLLTSILISMASAAPISAPIRSTAAAVSDTVHKRNAGHVGIHNKCAFDIFVEPVNQYRSEGRQKIAARSTWWRAQEDFGGLGKGVSLKMSGGDGGSGVAQFEYTVADDDNQVYYDLSLIDGNPFLKYPQFLESSDPTAPKVWCPPNKASCPAAYMTPTDNLADHAAKLGSNLNFYVC